MQRVQSAGYGCVIGPDWPGRQKAFADWLRQVSLSRMFYEQTPVLSVQQSIGGVIQEQELPGKIQQVEFLRHSRKILLGCSQH